MRSQPAGRTVPVPALHDAAAAGAGRAGLEDVAHRRARVRHQCPVATPPDQGLRPEVLRARCAVPWRDPEARTNQPTTGYRKDVPCPRNDVTDGRSGSAQGRWHLATVREERE